MKYAITMISVICGFVLATFMFGWILLFIMVIAKNTVMGNIPNPMFLADCYTAKTEYTRELSCEMAWGKR